MIALGETVQIECTITDFNGNLVDPDSHEIKIYDPSGTLILTFDSPTQKSTGVYTFEFTIPEDGQVGLWKVVWKVVTGSYVGIEEKKFYVEKA